MESLDILGLVSKYLPNICSVVCLIISLLIIARKNKANITAVLLDLSKKLPAFIKDAETKGFADGKAKFNYVLQLSLVSLATSLGITYEKAEKTYSDYISIEIEDILSTPQRKEN